ncbi:MAG: hypothetical protein WDW38_003149 [Sanguina aurantia]
MQQVGEARLRFTASQQVTGNPRRRTPRGGAAPGCAHARHLSLPPCMVLYRVRAGVLPSLPGLSPAQGLACRRLHTWPHIPSASSRSGASTHAPPLVVQQGWLFPGQMADAT